jgi:hypothetical protein
MAPVGAGVIMAINPATTTLEKVVLDIHSSEATARNSCGNDRH